ncbi:hypothetical protein FACS189472_12740 [Alphaproteobacteria bacterium]|nr:hypothetical protein FACS189472_12740 [Alphaproteobacteria bacterium]
MLQDDDFQINDSLHRKYINLLFNGTYYDGDFFEDTLNGTGTTTYNDGKKYTGDFAANLPNGYGTLTDRDGKILYTGKFVDGLMQ